MTMTEIYISTDVETDGPIPGPHSMLSFGSAAYIANKNVLSTFSANLETLPGASAHPKTAEWWATQPAAWEFETAPYCTVMRSSGWGILKWPKVAEFDRPSGIPFLAIGCREPFTFWE